MIEPKKYNKLDYDAFAYICKNELVGYIGSENRIHVCRLEFGHSSISIDEPGGEVIYRDAPVLKKLFPIVKEEKINDGVIHYGYTENKYKRVSYPKNLKYTQMAISTPTYEKWMKECTTLMKKPSDNQTCKCELVNGSKTCIIT